MSEEVLKIIGDVIKRPCEVIATEGEERLLQEMGFTSYNYMMCLIRLEDVLDVEFEDQDSLFMNVRTWGDFKRLLQSREL